MARTLITATPAPGCYGIGVTGALLSNTPADTANFNSTQLTGREVLVAYNSSGSTQFVTISSVPDALGRTTDIANFSIAAGRTAIFGPFGLNGWLQSDGRLYYKSASAAIKFSVVRVPAQ